MTSPTIRKLMTRDGLDSAMTEVFGQYDSIAFMQIRAGLGRAPGMVDDDITDNTPYLQSLADQGGLIILPPTRGRYAFVGTVTLNVPGTQIIAWGAPLRQVTRGMGVFDAIAPDCLIDGVDAVGALGVVDISGMSGSWEGSILASRWCVVNIYDTAHRLRIPWIRGGGMASVIRVAGWTKATNTEGTTRVKDVEIGTILCDRVEFAIAAKGTERIKIGSVRGTYGNVSNSPRASHLVYFADTGGGHRQVTVGDCAALGGLNGSAYQLKGITGGIASRLQAESCDGTLNVMDCTDLDVADVVSIGDLYAGAGGVLTVDTTTVTKSIRFRRVKLKLAANVRAVAVLTGEEISIDDLDIEVNHTTTGAATEYDVDIRGDRNRLGQVRIKNTGPNAWRAVGFFSGVDHVIESLKASGVRVGVDTRATNARVYYDRNDITLHATDGYSQMTTTGSVATGTKFVARQAQALLAPQNLLVADTFELPNQTAKNLGNTITGQVWEKLAGTWRIDGATSRAYESTGAASLLAVVESGQANVSVEAGILFQSGEGLTLRAIDNNNYLGARFSAGALTLTKWDAGVSSTLVTQPFTTQAGRRYLMMVRAFGDKIDVLIDGILVASHTLIAADQTKYGAVTKHGLRSSGSAAARFDSFRVLGLS